MIQLNITKSDARRRHQVPYDGWEKYLKHGGGVASAEALWDGFTGGASVPAGSYVHTKDEKTAYAQRSQRNRAIRCRCRIPSGVTIWFPSMDVLIHADPLAPAWKQQQLGKLSFSSSLSHKRHQYVSPSRPPAAPSCSTL